MIFYRNKIKSDARKITGASVLAVSMALCMAPAMAQDASPDEATAAEDMGDIVVTAQRRTERLQDVPISMTVAAGEALAKDAISNASDLAPRIPNLAMNRSPAGSGLLVIMRGVGSSTASASLEQSIVTFVDGIYGGNNRQFRGAFLDVERVEVLRGPQGALVGKNTSAGAINILTRRPQDEFGGYLNANYDFLLDGPTIEGALNLPLGEGFALRVAARYTDVEGYIRNLSTNRDEPTQEEFLGRVSLGFDNGGPVTAFIKYEHSQSDGLGTITQIWAPAIPGYELDYNKFSFTGEPPESVIYDTNNLVAQFDFDLDWATLTSITGYSGFKSRERLDADWTPIPGGIAQVDMELDQFSQEFRLVSPTDGNFDYAVGALFQTSDLIDRGDLGVIPRPTASTASSMDQNTRDISIYGQLGYDYGPFRLQGSLRYTNVRKTATYQRISGPLALQRIGTLVRDFDAELENNLWDPAVVLQYRPNSRVMLYASFQRGSKSGGFQGAISNAELDSFIIQPERSTSYEVGAKLGFGRGSYLNIAAFHSTYDDLQISAAIVGADGLSAPFLVGNAGSARAIGIEVDSVFRVLPGLEFAFNGAWNPEAEFVSYRTGPCPVDGSFLPPGGTSNSCDLSGLTLPYISEVQANGTVKYEHNLTDSLLLTASGTVIYRSSSRQAASVDFRATQDAYAKIDARIAVGASDGSWELGVVGRNLTNELTSHYIGAGGFSASVLGTPDVRSVTVAPPRQILATASFKF